MNDASHYENHYLMSDIEDVAAFAASLIAEGIDLHEFTVAYRFVKDPIIT